MRELETSSAAAWQGDGPETRPDAGQETGAVVSVSAVVSAVSATRPKCPNCGGVMSVFPLVVMCGNCAWAQEAPGRRPSARPLVSWLRAQCVNAPAASEVA